MLFIPIVILLIIVFAISIIKKIELNIFGLIAGASVFIGIIAYALGVGGMSADQEVWSGYVVDWEHKEEWVEHIPAKWESYYVTQTYSTYDSTKKRSVTRTKRVKKKRYIPAKNIHHSATNKIKTTDTGWISVYEFEGKKFSDSWPNTTSELKEMWKPNTPTASVHTYDNKIQNSDSIYKSTKQYEDLYESLPNYPLNVKNYINVNRLIGYFPNYDKAKLLLDGENSRLNVMKMTSEVEKLENRKILKDDEEDKKRAWKQVNMILVNLGDDVPQHYAYALKDYWGNGNKNDFIVCLSMGEDNVVDWVEIITWSESENLKIAVRDYILDNKEIKDSTVIVRGISNMVEKMFVRKEFADFDYISTEIPTWCYTFVIIYSFLALVGFIFFILKRG